MTMIANVLTHDYMVQVSDSVGTPPAGEVVNDLTPKTTIALGGSLLAGYTGLAAIGEPLEPTHRVITEVFSRAHTAPPSRVMSWVATEIQQRVNATRVPLALHDRRRIRTARGLSAVVPTNV